MHLLRRKGTMSRKLLLAPASALLLIATAVSASAHPSDNHWKNSRSTEGASATCDMWTEKYNVGPPDQLARIKCQLSDTLNDDDAVYVEWWQDGFGHIKMWNTADCCTHTVCDPDCSGTNWRYNGGGSFGTLYWKVCRDKGFPASDNCSSTVSHNT